MSKVVLKQISRLALVTLCTLGLTSNVYASGSDKIVDIGLARIKIVQASQKKIDVLSDQIEKIVSDLRTETKVVEGLIVYNDRLERTIEAQEVAMVQIEESIGQASLIERQVVPLMTKMIAAMDDFLELDMPFLIDERKARLERIKGYMTNANIAVSERFRQVMETYTRETRYGQTIEAYGERIEIDGNTLDVDILRIGRVAMYYQTKDGLQSGFWDNETRGWKSLSSDDNGPIRHAIRIALEKESPGLLDDLPVIAPEDV